MDDLIQRAAVMRQAGFLKEAESLYRQAIAKQPDSVSLLNNLGGVLDQLNRLAEAIVVYRRAAKLGPELVEPHFNLGEALLKAGKASEALAPLRAAATLDPGLQIAWATLGAAHLAIGEPTAAMGALRRAAELSATDAVSRASLGDSLQILGRLEEALPWYAEAVDLHPALVSAWYGMGRALLATRQPAAAVAALDRGLENDSGHQAARHEKAKALFQLGCVEEAMALLRLVARDGPPAIQQLARENLAIIVPGNPDDDNASILETRREWAAHLPKRRALPRKRGNISSPLRIGYVSAYFDRANWMKPVWAVVNRHDRARFQVHLFADAPPDAKFPGYLRQAADCIHLTQELSNDDLAALITQNNIDVLIDLNGFSVPKRLGMFALRPAAVQAAWFNLYATSGLAGIDYIIGDAHVIPTGEDRFFSERVHRVPGTYLAFSVDHPAPEPGPSPFRSTGRITIGSLASQYKITDQVVATWSEILQRCPKAHLLLRNAALDRPETRAHLLKRFSSRGIDTDRLTLEGRAPHFEFLATYDRIDFALDPFPYSGGTTTTEALWQGVPVITFDPGRWSGRTSLSLLRTAGLDEFIARDRQHYIELASTLATSPKSADRLAELRGTLRGQIQSSQACDTASLTTALEACYLRWAEG
ncbi:MAG: tetratricopeptide repeat protein [Planctomycetes bacterium]|nr:tetratricopeptide repeat protein [Planctomycetota bacterium]